ncbi:hypothetical protein WLH_05806 (plasmid) [Escherichia coli O25b:H4]|uniref:Uncharacterized protein n=1 Tax=Escherichia coli O25b:H4 TaxID=941280 RepID=A0A192CMW2_ECO25|nr:hypothetical protein WLH_05806 [Escherichia coli O25b:H4]
MYTSLFSYRIKFISHIKKDNSSMNRIVTQVTKITIHAANHITN